MVLILDSCFDKLGGEVVEVLIYGVIDVFGGLKDIIVVGRIGNIPK